MLTQKQIKKNLKKLDIKENFIIIHSDITGLIFKNFNLEKLWKIIFNSFGRDKTYIIPTFTLQAPNKKFWSYNKSESDTGILSEYFRKIFHQYEQYIRYIQLVSLEKIKKKYLRINPYQVLAKILFGSGFVIQKMFAIYL